MAHILVGAAYAGLRRPTEAIASYEKALRIDPTFADAHNNIGRVLADLGRLDEAIASYTKALQIKPDLAIAHQNLGTALRSNGSPGAAVAHYERVLELNPNFAEAHFCLGHTLVDLGRIDEAIASYQKAARLRPNHADAFNSLGFALYAGRQYEQAIASFRKALAISPNHVLALINLGRALADVGLREESVDSLTKALKLNPRDADAHNNIAAIFEKLGKAEDAIARFKRALELNPAHIIANANLCFLYDKMNRSAEFESALEQARRNGLAENPEILLLSAKALSRKKDAAATVALLKKIHPERLDVESRKGYCELLGKAYDALGEFDRAFAQFQEQNDIAKSSPMFEACDPEGEVDELVQLIKSWSSAEALDRTPFPAEGREVSLVFLVGFPRSGTTLLDTILHSHPSVVVLEEMPMILRARKGLGQIPTVEALDSLDEAGAARLRKAYLDELSLHIDGRDRDKVVIDKLPLSIRHAGLIQKIFPEAKFILALRHPCDCVLSCFMQNFELNSAMANFLTIEQTAKFYAHTMELWRAYRSRLGLEVGVVKYEDLIQDLRATCMPLITFLGLEWHDRLLDYQETAKARGRINTPSYDQVTQPLYKTAQGRWEDYRKHMEPVLPLLEPWIKEFGYAEDAGNEAT